jgi:hypothetical protein
LQSTTMVGFRVGHGSCCPTLHTRQCEAVVRGTWDLDSSRCLQNLWLGDKSTNLNHADHFYILPRQALILGSRLEGHALEEAACHQALAVGGEGEATGGDRTLLAVVCTRRSKLGMQQGSRGAQVASWGLVRTPVLVGREGVVGKHMMGKVMLRVDLDTLSKKGRASANVHITAMRQS